MAKTREGKWVPFCNPDEPFVEARNKFKALLGQRTHPDFVQVHYQDTDGLRRVWTERAPIAAAPAPTPPAKPTKRMKTALALFLGLALCGFSAQAQVSYPLYNGTSSNIKANESVTNTTHPRVINSRLATAALKFKLVNSGTDPLTFHFDGSTDGATFLSDSIGSLVVAANGTTLVETNINLDTAGNISMRVRVDNGNAAVAVTNLYVCVGLKRGVEPTLPIDIAYGGTAGATAAAARGALGIPAATSGFMTNLTVAGSVTNLSMAASLPVWTDVNKKMTNQTVAYSKVLMGIQAGSATSATDATGTNTFATAFSSAPYVVITPFGTGTGGTNKVVTSTTTNFTFAAHAAGITYHWIAIGAP